jgi:O-antigen ligase
LRVSVLGLLVGAPLAFGAVHEPAYVPLLIVAYAAGLLSWAHAHWARAHGEEVPAVPGRRALLLIHVVVLVQLVPLPPGLLGLVSPGTAAFHAAVSPLSAGSWRPITVSPAHTLRGLAFLSGMSLLYGTVFRQFREPRWRRRLAATVVATAFVMTLVALVQAASGEPGKIYGLWRPQQDSGVFGPYVYRGHYAGYMVMAIPLAFGFAAEALHDLLRAWRRRRRGWTALGEHEGNAALQRTAIAVFLVVGVLASQSRTGLMAFTLSAAALLLALRRRFWQVALVVVGVSLMGAIWVDFGGLVRAFETRGIRASRLDAWRDQSRLVPQFPLFGVGLNAFGPAYWRIQAIDKWAVWDSAHNEYFQALLDLGLVGAIPVYVLLARLFRTAIRSASRSAFSAGLLGGVLGSAFSNLVDFNWQIPANCATFVSLAGLVMGGRRDPDASPS